LKRFKKAVKKRIVRPKKENKTKQQTDNIDWDSPLEKEFYNFSKTYPIILESGFAVGPYKLDFAYFDKSSSRPRFKIDIEIDGLNFHSYLHQREHDYQRQIYLAMNDWYVLRFTGRQIFKNPDKCMNKILEYIKHLENKYNQKRLIIHEDDTTVGK